MQPIVRHTGTNDLYKHIEGNTFENLRTSKHGEVSDEAAHKHFKINIDATVIINKFPQVGNLINKLNLKIDNSETNE